MPLQAPENEDGLSAGLNLKIGRIRVNNFIAPIDTERTRSLTGLATWSFAAGQHLHLNLGHEWTYVSGTSTASNIWGLGFDQPLTENLRLTIETYGAESTRPDQQIGLRWEIAEGLKLSVAAGHGNNRNIANAGISWEF